MTEETLAFRASLAVLAIGVAVMLAGVVAAFRTSPGTAVGVTAIGLVMSVGAVYSWRWSKRAVPVSRPLRPPMDDRAVQQYLAIVDSMDSTKVQDRLKALLVLV